MLNDRYPNRPGHRRIDTSIEAANAIAPRLGHLQKAVLAAVVNAGPRGVTTNELADRLNIDRGSIQPRTSELRRLGLIRDGGARRPNANGKRAIVWIAGGAA
ncbi:MAG: MarR family transcriptional regulator [Sphingomonas sp.]|nr:MarR family transcriptional regulator [Sphingomonas sp.]